MGLAVSKTHFAQAGCVRSVTSLYPDLPLTFPYVQAKQKVQDAQASSSAGAEPASCTRTRACVHTREEHEEVGPPRQS